MKWYEYDRPEREVLLILDYQIVKQKLLISNSNKRIKHENNTQKRIEWGRQSTVWKSSFSSNEAQIEKEMKMKKDENESDNTRIQNSTVRPNNRKERDCFFIK